MNLLTSDSSFIRMQVIYTVASGSISINGEYAWISRHTLEETVSLKDFCLGAKAAIICTFSAMRIVLVPFKKCSICQAQQKNRAPFLKMQMKLYFIRVIKDMIASSHILLLLFMICYVGFILNFDHVQSLILVADHHWSAFYSYLTK